MTITTSTDEFCIRAGGLSEAEILRQRDDEAMKLSEEQNERFMDEIEGLHEQIEALKYQLSCSQTEHQQEKESHKNLRRMWDASEPFRLDAISEFLGYQIEELINSDEFNENGYIEMRLIDMDLGAYDGYTDGADNSRCPVNPFQYGMSDDTKSLINDCLTHNELCILETSREELELGGYDGLVEPKYPIMNKPYLYYRKEVPNPPGVSDDDRFVMVIPVIIDDNMGMVEMGLRLVDMGDSLMEIHDVLGISGEGVGDEVVETVDVWEWFGRNTDFSLSPTTTMLEFN